MSLKGSKFAHPVEVFCTLTLRIHAVHHIDLGQIGVVHDFPFASKVTQRFLFAQNGDDLGKEFSD